MGTSSRHQDILKDDVVVSDTESELDGKDSS